MIDDGFLVDGAEGVPPEWSYLPHDDTLRRLTAEGERLVAERNPPRAEAMAENAFMMACLRRRAEAIRARDAAPGPSLDRFLEEQEREFAILDEAIAPAVWLLERA